MLNYNFALATLCSWVSSAFGSTRIFDSWPFFCYFGLFTESLILCIFEKIGRKCHPSESSRGQDMRSYPGKNSSSPDQNQNSLASSLKFSSTNSSFIQPYTGSWKLCDYSEPWVSYLLSVLLAGHFGLRTSFSIINSSLLINFSY